MTAPRRPPCLICEQEDADDSMTVFCEDAGWAAGVVRGYDVPGWFVLRIRRHAEGLEGLTTGELAAFGRRARDPHFHALITPRTADVPVEMRTGDILKLRLGHTDLDGALAMVPVVRAAYERFSAQTLGATA